MESVAPMAFRQKQRQLAAKTAWRSSRCPRNPGRYRGWQTLLSIREYLILATVAPSLCLDCFPLYHWEARSCAVQFWDWRFSVPRRWEHPPRPLTPRTNSHLSSRSTGMAATMAITVARDASSTDGGDSSVGKHVVTIGNNASGRGLLTTTMRSQDLTVTTGRVIRADCVSSLSVSL